MNKLIWLILFSSLFVTVQAQKKTHINVKAKAKVNPDSVYNEVQIMPRFRGDVNKYLADHIQYPEVEKEAGITGTVYVSFVIEKDSTITGVKVMRGVPGGPGLDKESVRVISTMPKWIPGTQDGILVRVRYNIPIHFQLR